MDELTELYNKVVKKEGMVTFDITANAQGDYPQGEELEKIKKGVIDYLKGQGIQAKIIVVE